MVGCWEIDIDLSSRWPTRSDALVVGMELRPLLCVFEGGLGMDGVEDVDVVVVRVETLELLMVCCN